MSLTKAEMNKLASLMLKMDKNDAPIVCDLYNQALRLIQQQTASTFKVGDIVQFPDKYNRKIQGKITKINRKTIKVDCDVCGLWTVSPNLLSKI